MKIDENCTIHKYNVVPLRSGRYLLVGGNYEAGTCVTDFTDPANPVALGWSDPPVLVRHTPTGHASWAAPGRRTGTTTSSTSPASPRAFDTAGGVRLAYETAGRGDPALVLLHGWCGDRSIFAPQFTHFAEHPMPSRPWTCADTVTEAGRRRARESRLVVLGSGVQGRAHVRAIARVLLDAAFAARP